MKERYILATIFVTTLLLRLPFASKWLEDWDSVQFALSLHHFSILDHQPHPPGYPLYVLMGKLTDLFIGDDLTSLVSLSILFSSLTTILFYKLTKEMFDLKTAVLATVMLIFIPIFWVFSELPLTNIPGLFFYLLSIYLIFKFHNQIKIMIFTSFLAGFILGVRATEYPVILSLLGLVILKHSNPKYSLGVLIAFVTGIVAWFIPVLFLTGIENFKSSLITITSYATSKSLFIQDSLFLENIFLIRLEKFIYLFKISYTYPLLIVSVVSFLWLIFKKKNSNKFEFRFLYVWILFYGFLFFILHMLLYYDLGLPQYTLAILLPLIILTSYVCSRYRWMFLVYLVVVIQLAYTSWSYLKNESHTIPPTISPVLYVKDKFNPQDTTLITTFTYRQFQYYAPEFENYYPLKNTPTKLKENVIIDYNGLATEIPSLKGYTIVDSKEFSNSKLIFSRINNTKIFILKLI